MNQRPRRSQAAAAPLSEEELAVRLRLAVGRLSRRLRTGIVSSLPPLQASTLATLHNRGAQRFGALSELEAVAPPTMSRVVASLVERGYVTREPDPADKRSVIVAITEAGGQAVLASRSQRTKAIAQRLEALDAEQRTALELALPALERLVEAGSEGVPVPGSPPGDSLAEPADRGEPDSLAEPADRGEPDSLSEPADRAEPDSLSEPADRAEPDSSAR